MTLSHIRQHGTWLLDADGGQMILRGINLGGDSKVPWPDGGTDHPSDFADHREVSFIGRPFPLEESDEHFGRLAHWGFNTVRLLTTWEAVEHRGPGQYDHAYLDYFTEICRRAHAHGLYVFVDFHQDVWSRMTGGDGAPGWVFDAVGLDFTKFDAADAAHVMQARYDYASSEPLQRGYPRMSWGSNYRLPANGILWTLFWGGSMFTPDFEVAGENVQDFLQGHYLGSMDRIAQRLRDLPNVLGFDTLNEPGTGWFGERLSYRHTASSAERPERPRVGPALSVLDSIAIARGVPRTVPLLARDEAGVPVPVGTVTLNSAAVSIWKSGVPCPFEQAGAYRMEGGALRALDEDIFRRSRAGPVTLSRDAFGPFFSRVAATIRRHQSDWSVVAERDAFAHLAGRSFPTDAPERCVNASHWYDLATLYRKHFDPLDHYCYVTGEREVGAEVIGARFRRELGEIASHAAVFRGGAPTLIGEFGIPFDLDAGAAYRLWSAGERENVWRVHVDALSLMYDAIDELALHSTLWNYSASNRNDLRVGDGWNQEDLSIFSRDQQDDPRDPDSGARAIRGFCRPYVRRLQGRLTRMRFEHGSGDFSLSFEAQAAIEGVTDIYVPRLRYPHGYIVRIEGAPVRLSRSASEQRLAVQAVDSGFVWLSITPSPFRAEDRT